MKKNKNTKKNNSAISKAGFLNRFISRTCCIFTCAVLILSLFCSLFLEKGRFLLMPSNVFLIFAASVGASLSLFIYKTKKLSFWTAHALNFAVLGVIWYAAAVLPNTKEGGANIFVSMGIYIFIYLIATIITAVVREKNKKKKTDSEEYTSKF